MYKIFLSLDHFGIKSLLKISFCFSAGALVLEEAAAGAGGGGIAAVGSLLLLRVVLLSFPAVLGLLLGLGLVKAILYGMYFCAMCSFLDTLEYYFYFYYSS